MLDKKITPLHYDCTRRKRSHEKPQPEIIGIPLVI